MPTRGQVIRASDIITTGEASTIPGLLTISNTKMVIGSGVGSAPASSITSGLDHFLEMRSSGTSYPEKLGIVMNHEGVSTSALVHTNTDANTSYWDFVTDDSGTNEVRVSGNKVWHAGNFDPNTKLNLSGGTLTGAVDASIIYNDDSGISIPFVKGGRFATTTSSYTGYMKITLPVSWTNTMMQFLVDVYDYASGESFTLYVGGYNYSTGPTWANTSAYIIGNNMNRNFTVRFGHDGSKCAIYVGESTTVWNYPQVNIRDFFAGYSGANTQWNGTWAIGFTTTLGTINSTISNTLTVSSAALTSDKLTTARTISLTGDVTGSVSFDGTGNVSIATTYKNSGVSAGTYRSVTVDAKGNVTAGTNPTTLSGYGITDAVPSSDVVTTATANKILKLDANSKLPASITGNADGNAATATKLATARTISLTGDVTGSVSFDGTGNVSIASTYKNSGVTAGTYRSVTVDAKGNVTAGTNPTTLSGYGITDAAPLTHTSDQFVHLGESSAGTDLNTLNGKLQVTRTLNTSANKPGDYFTVLNIPVSGNSDFQIASSYANSNAFYMRSRHDSTGNWLSWEKLWTNANLSPITTSDVVTTATANKILKLDANSKLPASITGNADGNAATATKLATARTITLGGDLSGSASFDGSANITITAAVADDSHNHVIANVDGLQTALDAIVKTSSATLPATAGWYRIAQSPVDIGRCSGRFEVDWYISGNHGQVIFNSAIMYGSTSTVAMNQTLYSNYGGGGLTKARLVYHTTYTGNYAYLEVYNSTSSAITVTVQGLGLMNWSLVTPSTVGSIPSGYTNKEISFIDGITTEGSVKTGTVTGVNYIYGSYGTIAKSTDEWLRINEDASHTSGTYFGSTIVRTDGELQVGSSGASFKASSAGVVVNNTITLAKHPTDNSLRVSNNNGYIDIAPKNTSYSHIYTDLPSFYFNKELHVNGNKVWNAGNDGSGSGLDADTIDGFHATALMNDKGADTADWNTITEMGVYRVGRTDWSGTSNTPTSAYAYGTLVVTTSGTSTTQTFYPHNSAGGSDAKSPWTRTKWSASDWGVWAKIWTSMGFDPSTKLDASANAVSASKLATARTISLTGDVTGSTTFDGSGNVSITATVADDSHNHVISNVDGLQTALDGKETPSGAQSKVDTHSNDYLKHTGYGATTGSANTYALTLSPALSAYTEGVSIRIKINVDNTGSSTLNVNGLGAKSIVKSNGMNVESGNLKANSVYTLVYNGTNFILQGEGSEISNADSTNFINTVNDLFSM